MDPHESRPRSGLSSPVLEEEQNSALVAAAFVDPTSEQVETRPEPAAAGLGGASSEVASAAGSAAGASRTVDTTAAAATSPAASGQAAGSTAGSSSGTVSIRDQIDKLKEEQRVLKAANKDKVRHIRNAERRSKRLKGKVAGLTDEDISEVLRIRAESKAVAQCRAAKQPRRASSAPEDPPPP